MKKYFSFSMVALALCVLCFPSVQAQDPVPDPMFSPEVAPEPGAVKTMLNAGVYLNSDQFALNLMAMPIPMAPVSDDTPATVLNETTCTFLIWRSDPDPAEEYKWLPPGTNTETDPDPTWAGDSVDFVRIACVWYKLQGQGHIFGVPLTDRPVYRLTEVPCGSRNFAVEQRLEIPFGYTWAPVAPHPCGQPKPWPQTGTIWCPPGPVGPCHPLLDPECEDCEGTDPGQGGGELP
jgi:hypothetical protein